MRVRPSARASFARPPRDRAPLLALALATLLPVAAAAHPEFASAGTNRYLKLTLLGGGAVRLAYTVMVGEGPATEGRRLADANHDGTVDAAEQASAARALLAAVTAGLHVTVDGHPAAIAWETPTPGFSSDLRVGPLPYSIDLVGRIQSAPGDHRLRLDDDTPLPALAETDVKLEESPMARILAAWQAAEDGNRQLQFVFQGPQPSALTDRSIGLHYQDLAPAPSPARRRRPLPIALLGPLVGGAIAAWFLRRRRRPS